jgi:hypothetical protein
VAERLESTVRSSVYYVAFQRDVQYGLAGTGKAGRIEISCEPRAALKSIGLLLVERDNYDVARIGKQFLQRVGTSIARHGVVSFQLVKSEDPGRLWLMSLMPETIYVTPFATIQILRRPHRIPDLLFLDPKTVYSIQSPVITPSAWRRHIRRMAELERSTKLSMMLSMQSGSNAGYRVATHDALARQAMLQEMSFIDWPLPYRLKPEQMSDVFYWVKWLRFQRHLLDIRENALTVLNAILDEAGSRMGFKATAQHADYPGRDAYVSAESAIVAGTASPSVVRSFT